MQRSGGSRKVGCMCVQLEGVVVLEVGRVERFWAVGFYKYFTRQRGELGDPLRGRCKFSGRCTEIGGSRDPGIPLLIIYVYVIGRP